MKVKDLLEPQKHAELLREHKSRTNTHSGANRANRRNSERLSTKEVESLMGVHRDKYTKRNGRVRRK